MEQTRIAKAYQRRGIPRRTTDVTSNSEPGPSSSSPPVPPQSVVSPLTVTTEFGQNYGVRNAPRLFVTNPDPDTAVQGADEATPTANTLPHQRQARTHTNADYEWHPVDHYTAFTTPRINPSSLPTGEPECGICGDKVLLLNEGPLSALEASSPGRPLGIALRCYGMVIGHTYCFTCISGYLKTKLADASFRTVFPIRCPECPYIIMDQQAERILDRQDLEGLWYWAKLFEEVQTFYCPNGKCATRIELPSRECSRSLRKTDCPECKEAFCFRCQSPWHEGQSCAQFAHVSGAAALDKALQKLAKRSNWRRCPKCRIVVERDEGCRHIMCRCGYEFCYQCGREWRNGCGLIRSLFCFPIKPDSWPETRGRIVDYVQGVFTLRRSSA